MKLFNPLLIVTAIILVIFNCIMIAEIGARDTRWIQILCSSSSLAIFLGFTKKKHVIIVVPFLLFVLSDVLLLFFEKSGVREITAVISILTYITLIQNVRVYIKKARNSFGQGILLLAIFAINVLMLYLLIDMVNNSINNPLLIYLFYIYGFVMLLLVIMAFSYNNRYSNRASFYFVIAVLALVIGEIASFIAYYIDISFFAYPERIFYILGLFCLLKFSTLPKKEGILLNEDFF